MAFDFPRVVILPRSAQGEGMRRQQRQPGRPPLARFSVPDDAQTASSRRDSTAPPTRMIHRRPTLTRMI